MRLVLLLGLSALLTVAAAQPGSLDPSFTMGGQVTLAQGDDPYQGGFAVASLADGRVVVGGLLNGQAAVYRFTAAGALDPTFSADGIATAAVGTAGSYVDDQTDLVVMPDGRVVLSVTRVREGDSEAGILLAFTASGQLDPSFGTEGRAVVPGVLGLSSAGLDGSGRLVVVGYGERDNLPVIVVSRYSSAGALDAGYGTGGQFRTSLNGGPIPTRATVRPDGAVVLAGQQFSFDGGLEVQPFLLRLTAAGQPDAGFGTDGVVRLSLDGDLNGFIDVDVDAQGRVVAVGYASIPGSDADQILLARFTATGELDASFGTGGLVQPSFGTTNAVGLVVEVQPDGGLVIAGAVTTGFDDRIAVARFTEAGALDLAFGTGGVTVLDAPAGSIEQGTGLARQADGRLVVVGYRDEFTKPVALRLARLVGGGATAADPSEPVAAVTLTMAGPNPAHGAARLTLRADQPQPIRVAVYDALGREVAVLLDGVSGSQPLAFGADLAPGVYLVRARWADGATTVRVVRS